MHDMDAPNRSIETTFRKLVEDPQRRRIFVLEELFGWTSHELNNIANSVVVHLDLWNLTGALAADDEKHQVISMAANRLLHLGQLMDSRVSKQRTSFDLRTVVRDGLRPWARGQDGFEFEWQLDDSGSIRGHWPRLALAVHEMFCDVIKRARDSRRLHISTGQRRDHGPGSEKSELVIARNWPGFNMASIPSCRPGREPEGAGPRSAGLLAADRVASSHNGAVMIGYRNDSWEFTRMQLA